MDEEEEKLVLVQILIDLMERISSIADFWNAYKKPLCNLSRRINLLVPMFEELKENKMPLLDRDIEALFRLRDALDSAKELLQLGSHGSKIFLALKWDKMMEEVTIQMLQALDGISFENFDISDEVREQFDLVHAQFKRANERTDHMLDVELFDDIYSVYDRNNDVDPDHTILGKLAENLQLMTITDLKQESLALQEMVVATGGRDPGQSIEKMSMLLKEMKDFLQIQNPAIGHSENSKAPSSYKKLKHPAIPEDFRCPISLELMKDPVIVGTGQTYERACIEKWLRGGHGTCPKTQQKLSNMSLTPNFLLRSLISQWCEANGVEPPKCPPESNKPISGCTPSERSNIESLIIKLSSLDIEDQRSAAGELRLLAKRNTNNRMCIAESGAIPILISLLATNDFHTQEHAVTALLNLSILEENKGRIISLGAVTGIVHVVKNGSMEARENGAAALFSLSVIDEYKVAIGQSGAIPALVSLLNEGSLGGKKDAASALFNLCIYPGNKAKAVRAGVVTVLLELLTEPASPMMDEALAVMAILSSHHESKVAIGAARVVPVLVDVIETASPRNRENAAAVLVHLCSGEFQAEHLIELQERGVMGPLMELASNGTERAKRKAARLIDRINQFVEQQEQAQAIIQAADSKLLSRQLAFTTFSDI